MKQIYLIHAYHHLEYLNYLIGILSGIESVVYVNIDKKSTLDCSKIDHRAIQVRERVSINWGGWSQCAATLNSLRQIHAEQPEYGHVIFISGQDLPVYATAAIAEQLQKGTQYIDCKSIDEDWPQAKKRLQHFHLSELTRIYVRRKGLAGIAGRVLYRGGYYLANYTLRLVKGGWRKLPLGLKAYGGSQWWMLDQACVQHILEYTGKHPELISFFRKTFCSDELFFHTIIMNSPFRGQVAPMRRYTDWANSPDGKSPKVLGIEDYEAIKASGDLICRKVDPVKSLELINRMAEENGFPTFIAVR